MRDIIPAQRQLGERDIAAIEFDSFSRDDIPRLLRGLQHIYTTDVLREAVFAILADVLPVRADGEEFVSAQTGRPGMSQWRILVLGTLRLGLDADYDRVQELANHDALLKAADELIAPVFSKSIENNLESRTLAQTRDLLLPKLMSGDIRLRDAERAVEAVL